MLNNLTTDMDSANFYEYYKNLKRGEKNQFVAVLMLKAGGSWRTWVDRLIKKEQCLDTLNPPTRDFVCSLVENEEWRKYL